CMNVIAAPYRTLTGSSLSMPRISSRSSGPSVCPCTDTACSAAARTTSSSSPLMVRVHPDSLGNSRQSAVFRIVPPGFDHRAADTSTTAAPAPRARPRHTAELCFLFHPRTTPDHLEVAALRALPGTGQPLRDADGGRRGLFQALGGLVPEGGQGGRGGFGGLPGGGVGGAGDDDLGGVEAFGHRGLDGGLPGVVVLAVEDEDAEARVGGVLGQFVDAVGRGEDLVGHAREAGPGVAEGAGLEEGDDLLFDAA